MNERDYIERRLRPSPSMPDYYTLRHLLEKIKEIVAVLERSGWEFPLRVLDAGAGCAPYRSLFPPDRFRYVAVDKETIAGLSVLADGQSLPFSDGAFDLVLSNQVLEHVTDPNAVVRELKRMVSKRGYLALSCPFVWELHNFPADYWRFSEQALDLFFSDMDRVYLEASTTTAQCLVQTFNLFVNRNFSSELLKAALFRITNSRLAARAMSRRDALLPANYVLVARKRAPQEVAHAGAVAAHRFRIHVDTPAAGARLPSPALQVIGWIAADVPVEQVLALVDGVREYPLPCNLPRPDVWRAFPQFRHAHRSGFAGVCDLEGLAAGEHALEIAGVLGEQAVKSDPIRFRVC